MADKNVPNPNDTGVIEKYTDMGDGTFRLNVIANAPAGSTGTGGYPVGATPSHGSSGGVSNAVATATLPAEASKTTYITALHVTGAGATAASVVYLSLTGLINGQANYAIAVPAPAQASIVPLMLHFNPPIPASAANTAITASLSAFGAGNGQASVEIYGFRV